eukprot:TRINITY_DN69263_c0_g1_i1.p1 TRINITY_DN69263_c0_g1~~TRINITY_DN69263_c0_g1_i1.p1  ORF type:complete len:124 (-),score=0.79 TRINITY_DN69263_c0_g1_i1:61-396(-)
MVDRCQIVHCGDTAIEISDGQVTITDTTIRHCGKSGLLIHNSSVDVTTTSISDACGVLVDIRSNSRASISNCRLFNGRMAGCFVHDTSTVTMENSVIFNTLMPSIDCRTNG